MASFFYLLLLMTFLRLCTPSVLSSSGGVSSVGVNLTALIQQPMINQPEIFEHALNIINSLDTAPSCHRLATKTLLNSCKSLEVSVGGHNVELDEIKSTFAARLAVCELRSAHAVIPEQCASMLPKGRKDDHGFRCLLPGSHCGHNGDNDDETKSEYPRISQNNIEQCLSALESRPQSWTSYSNARQNAMVICHAARHEIEKDQILETHRSTTKASWRVTDAISQAFNRSKVLLEAQKAFVEAVQKTQKQALKDMKEGQAFFSRLLGNLANQIEQSFLAVSARFTQGTEQAIEQIDKLDSKIKNSAKEAADAQTKISEAMEHIAAQQHGHAQAQSEVLASNHRDALAISTTLAAVKDEQIADFRSAVDNMRQDMKSVSSMLEFMFVRQLAIDKRMEDFEQTIQHILRGAAEASNTIEAFTALQELLFLNFTTQVESANRLATELSNSIRGVDVGRIGTILGYFKTFSIALAALAGLVSVWMLSWMTGAEVARRAIMSTLLLCALLFLYLKHPSFS